jgi:hypothetical protein
MQEELVGVAKHPIDRNFQTIRYHKFVISRYDACTCMHFILKILRCVGVGVTTLIGNSPYCVILLCQQS